MALGWLRWLITGRRFSRTIVSMFLKVLVKGYRQCVKYHIAGGCRQPA